MKLRFITPGQVNLREWARCTERLEADLAELTAGTPAEEEVHTYLSELISLLRPAAQKDGKHRLFLMYDSPASMSAGARADYMYRPTYLAAAILTSAMYRYPRIWEDAAIRESAYDVLSGALRWNFTGGGNGEIKGLLSTLDIFFKGDTVRFIDTHPDFHKGFTKKLKKAIAFLETDICSGSVKNPWSGLDYREEGDLLLYRLKNSRDIDRQYVWYACYGSNINRERFMLYINRCTDTTPPEEDRPFHFEHDIYFSKISKTWQNGGKAFLDHTTPGSAYGRIYKITRSQYDEIRHMEGKDYRKKLYFGLLDGIPIYSFTNTHEKSRIRMPSGSYFRTILEGLRDCYGSRLTEQEIAQYLIRAVMPAQAFRVSRAIAENQNIATIQQISEYTDLSMDDAAEAIKWLLAHEVIAPSDHFGIVEHSHEGALIDAMLHAMP